MIQELFDEVSRDVGFTAEDAALLKAAKPFVEEHLDDVVDEFYRAIRGSSSMRAVFDDDAQIERQKRSLRVWLKDVFGGTYDADYVERHAHVGRVHLHIGLGQRYMISMMGVLRTALSTVFDDTNGPFSAEERKATVCAVHRILDLELAIMLGTYRTLYLEQMRANERLATLGQVAAGIGHDLRNPLAVIDSSAHLLQRGDLDERAARHVQKIRDHAELCSRIVNGLMDLARDRPLIRSRESLGEVVKGAVAGAKGGGVVNLEIDEVEIDVDPTLVRQVIVNLIENAVQAGAEQIKVIVRPAKRSATIVVQDDGSGIPPRLLGRVFEPLVSGRKGGVGLGLALCHRIISEHGGQITGKNLPEGGAEFTVRLPLTPTPNSP